MKSGVSSRRLEYHATYRAFRFGGNLFHEWYNFVFDVVYCLKNTSPIYESLLQSLRVIENWAYTSGSAIAPVRPTLRSNGNQDPPSMTCVSGVRGDLERSSCDPRCSLIFFKVESGCQGGHTKTWVITGNLKNHCEHHVISPESVCRVGGALSWTLF